ncbi:MAG: ATP-binding cassette domain-containing protein [Oscillospiraceae bacterium]|nr:ATP-binding cassette domain-containing protein [Oscillospiraceae bacterium]
MKLHVENLQKSYATKAVLTGASYSFEKGKIYGLLGRNGAGKTTMFNCLADNIPLDEGSCYMEFDGIRHPTALDDIGFVFTQPHLPEFMTGYEFIKYFVDINRDKISGPVDIDASFALLDFDRADSHKLIKEYSHGMQTKVQLLAFLILRPNVILLDEPLTAFDVVVAVQIKNLIKSLKNDHIIIFSTHILELAQDLCDEIVVLHNGTLSTLDSSKLHDKEFENEVLAMLTEEKIT